MAFQQNIDIYWVNLEASSIDLIFDPAIQDYRTGVINNPNIASTVPTISRRSRILHRNGSRRLI
jgi:hypothetical protein